MVIQKYRLKRAKIKFPCVFHFYIFRRRTLCQIHNLSHSRSTSESQKGRYMTSEGRTCHQKDDHSEGSIQKGDNQKVATLEVPHRQRLFHTIQWSFKKVKHDLTRSKRSADKFEKLMNLQQLLFFFCVTFTYWGRKLHLLFLVLNQWIKTAQGLRFVHFNGYIFEDYKSWKNEEEWVGLLKILSLQEAFYSQTFWTSRKLHIVTSNWKIFSTDLY